MASSEVARDPVGSGFRKACGSPTQVKQFIPARAARCLKPWDVCRIDAGSLLGDLSLQTALRPYQPGRCESRYVAARARLTLQTPHIAWSSSFQRTALGTESLFWTIGCDGDCVDAPCAVTLQIAFWMWRRWDPTGDTLRT